MHDTACLAPFSRCDQLFADEHSANPCPAFLAAITYARLVVENWTSPYQSGHVRRTGVCLYAGPTFWNSMPENLENIKFTLSVFTRFFFFSYCIFSAFEVSIGTRYRA